MAIAGGASILEANRKHREPNPAMKDWKRRAPINTVIMLLIAIYFGSL